MDIKGETVRLDRIFKKVALLTIIIIIILNANTFKVNAEVNNNISMDLNSKVHTLSNKDSDNILDNLIVALTGKIAGFEVVLNEEIIGYTVLENNLDNIKKEVLKIYMNENSIKEDMVKSFDIKWDIQLIEKRFDIEMLQTNEDLIKDIYNIAKEEPQKIKITVSYTREEINSIKPETQIIQTENLYLGESKIEEGEYGLKRETKELVSESGKVVSKRVIKEEIIKEQIDKKIYRGTKNPYKYGVAFLSQPTRGGVMTSGYGERWHSFHKGIDIAGNIGDDVLVAMDGEVVYAQYNDGGYGNLIIVKHEDNMSTYYGHLNDFSVEVGDKVQKGNIIGKVGNTGFSTGPHLHFELRVNNEPVDPTNYIVQ